MQVTISLAAAPRLVLFPFTIYCYCLKSDIDSEYGLLNVVYGVFDLHSGAARLLLE
jgi:hypothetical protein